MKAANAPAMRALNASSPTPTAAAGAASGVPVPASRLRADVDSLLSQFHSSFVALLSPSSTIIGHAVAAPSFDPNDDSDTTITKPLPLSQLSHADIEASLFTQRLHSSVHAAALVEAAERLVALVAHVKIAKILNDKKRFADAAERARDLIRLTNANDRASRSLIDAMKEKMAQGKGNGEEFDLYKEIAMCEAVMEAVEFNPKSGQLDAKSKSGHAAHVKTNS